MKTSLTQTIINAYGDFFENRRPVVVLFVVLMTLAAGYGVSRLTIQDDVIELFVDRNESVTAESGDIGARTDQAILVMLEADELFNSEVLGVIWNSSERIKKVDGVSEVVSLYDLRTPKRFGRRRTFVHVIPPPDAENERIERAREQARNHPMAKEQLISKNGNATLILVQLERNITTTDQLRTIVTALQDVLTKSTDGTNVTASVSGVPSIRVELGDSMKSDQLIFNSIGPVISALIAFLVFRRFASVIVVMVGAGTGVFWSVGFLGLIGEPLNPVNGVIAPLALTIGLADSVHVLLHIRRHRAAGDGSLKAAAAALRTVGFASALTSITSAIGFASLGIAEMEVLARFGLCSAMAVVLAFLSVMTVVPLLGSSVLGNYVQPKNQPKTETNVVRKKWHTHLVEFIVKHRFAVLIVCILATGWATYMASQIRAEVRVSNGLPTKGEPRRAFREIESQFGGSLPLVVTVGWSKATRPTAEQVYSAINDAHQVLAGKSITGPPLSLVNLYQSMAEKDQNPKSLFQTVATIPRDQIKHIFDQDNRRAVIITRCQDVGGQQIDEMMTVVENELEELQLRYPGFEFRITETILKGIRASNAIVGDLILSLIMAVPITIFVLMLAMRSFKVGVIALLPNIFPMVALAATVVVFDQAITVTAAAVFVMCFGIAVDDTIHTITAFNRYFNAGQSVNESIVSAYRELGDAILTTTAILIGGMVCVMFAQAFNLRIFGMMFCLGLIWAVVGDLIILPAVLACYPHKRKKTAVASGKTA